MAFSVKDKLAIFTQVKVATVYMALMCVNSGCSLSTPQISHKASLGKHCILQECNTCRFLLLECVAV
jgi:hypothetical protein